MIDQGQPNLFEARCAAKRAVRKQAIDRLQDEARRAGGITDRLYWTMVYDFEMAPLTTNLQQLRELGIEVPPEAGLEDEELERRLWEVIEGLARLQVYLISTDHLSDRDLYRQLEQRVLREEVREVPPEPGVREYIDLATVCDGPGTEAVATGASRDARLPRPAATGE